jgi:hypothetical protein
MVGEAFAGLSAIKTAFDIAKGLKDIDDATRRNAAVIELQEKILSAQQTQSALVEQVRELEAQVVGFEKWDAEAKRYKLTDFGGNTLAYALKPEATSGEPPHRICPKCYEDKTKSILQYRTSTAFGQERYSCPNCKTDFDFGHRHRPDQSRGPSWPGSRGR